MGSRDDLILATPVHPSAPLHSRSRNSGYATLLSPPHTVLRFAPGRLPLHSAVSAPGATFQVAVNRDKPDRWKADIVQSVDLYNDWFMKFAPKAFRETRIQTTKDVEAALHATRNLTDISPSVMRANPGVLPTLRMSTCPPLARDRLIGLARVPKSVVGRMEEEAKLPVRMNAQLLDTILAQIGSVIAQLADRDIFPWLDGKEKATPESIHRAATIVADRLCSAMANPIIRNAQESRQLKLIGDWLTDRGYRLVPAGSGLKMTLMEPGTFAFRLSVPAALGNSGQSVNIPIDAVIRPKTARRGDLPLLVEAKSAGDFTNVNKRRKEEAQKMAQLRAMYGSN